MNILKLSMLFLSVTLVIGLAACSSSAASRINTENYDKIQSGMTSQQVTDILGKPTSRETKGGEVLGFGGSVTTMTWTTDNATIRIDFLNDQVVKKDYKGK